jgi:outer membrane protein TolC
MAQAGLKRSILFGSCAGFFAASLASAQSLTLHEMIQSSIKESSQEKSSRLILNAAALRRSAEEKTLWPNLVFESSHGRGESMNADSAIGRSQNDGWISRMSIGSSWQLLDNGERAHRVKLSDIELHSAKAEQNLAGMENRFKLTQAFFNWQKIGVQEGIDHEVRQLLTTQFKQTERQFRQGLKTSRDYQRMRAELKRLELQDTTKTFRNEEVIHQISQLSGLAVEQVRKRGVTKVNSLPESGSKLLAQLSRESASSLQDDIDRLKLERARTEALRVDQLRVYPELKFTLLAEYGTANYLPDFAADVAENLEPSWSAILSLNYELWDWGAKRMRAQAGWENFRAEEVKLAEAHLQRQVARQIRQVKLDELSKQYDLAVELLKLEQSNFDLVQSEFRQGKLSYLDMITALRELSTARRQRFDFYFQIIDQLAEIHFAEGNLDEWAKNF